MLVDRPVVLPVAMETTWVAALYANTEEYQTMASTSATTKHPPHDGAEVGLAGPPRDAAAEIRMGSAVPGLSISGQVRSATTI